MIPAQLREVFNEHWNLFHQSFDLTSNEGCGQFTESAVNFAQNAGYSKVGHLKKNPGQTQYNGHANDAFLYADGEGNEGGKFQAVDIIANAESKPPYTPSHQPPSNGWTVDIPRYTMSDWIGEVDEEPIPEPEFPGYEELGGDALAREIIGVPLEADYKEANQALNDGSVVWTNRTVYDALYYYFVDGMEPRAAYEKSAAKRRPEWRKVLGLG